MAGGCVGLCRLYIWFVVVFSPVLTVSLIKKYSRQYGEISASIHIDCLSCYVGRRIL